MMLFLFFLIAGLILIFVEIFVPGGIFGFIGSIFLVISSVFCFNLFGLKIGIYYLTGLFAGVMLFMVLAIHFARYIPFRKRLFLTTSQKGVHVDSGLDALVGKEGIAYTMLRPTGKALIEGKRYDAMTEGLFVDKNRSVEVIRIKNNHLIVREKKS